MELLVLRVRPTLAFIIPRPCILYLVYRKLIKRCIGSSELSLVSGKKLRTLNRIYLDCPRRAPGYFTLIGDKASPVTRDSSEVARVYKINVAILTPEMADIVGVLSSCLSLSVGFSIQDEAMDDARGLTTTMRTLFTVAPLTGN